MAHHVNFGLWYDFRNPAPWTVPFETLYAQTLEQIVGRRASRLRLGVDHRASLLRDGYTPSPLVIAAAIGARTQRLRIGTNLMILPLHNPVRVAEDAATLALLTGGRFDLGVGIGYRELEFREFGRQLIASAEPDRGGDRDHPQGVGGRVAQLRGQALSATATCA